MVVGLCAFDSTASVGTKCFYNSKNNCTSLNWDGNFVVSEFDKGFVEINAKAGMGSGIKNDRKTISYGVGANAGYTQIFDDLAFLGVKAGADVGYGNTYKGGDRIYKGSFGYYWDTYKIGDVPYSGLNYGPIYTSYTNPKTDKKDSWYVTPEVTAQAGVLLNNGIITAQGTMGKDVISGDKYTQASLKYEGTIGGVFEDAGLDASYSIEGGYTFNDKNLTTNLLKKDGLNFSVGIAMHF